jgi:5-hydroxyisourate hydrolase-like protein (transthyretin family)
MTREPRQQMKRRLLLIPILVAVAGVLLWRALQDESSTLKPNENLTRQEGEADASAATSEAKRRRETAATPSSPPATIDEESLPASRKQIESREDTRLPLLEARYADLGIPAPDVEVYLLTDREMLRRFEVRGATGVESGRSLDGVGRRVTTDEQGRARFDFHRDRIRQLSARTPSHRGIAYISEDDRFNARVPITLDLYPYTSIPVRVISSEGEPVPGVTVGLGRMSRRKFSLQNVAQTDAEGRAQIELKFVTRGEVKARLRRITVLGLFREPVYTEIEVGIDSLPEQTLTLPPFGMVDVLVKRPPSLELPQMRRIARLSVLPPDGADSEVIARTPQLSALFDCGKQSARFLPVGLNLDLVATLEPGGSDRFTAKSARGRGPEAVAAVSQIVIPLLEDASYLTGRILREDGGIHARASMSLRIGLRDANGSSMTRSLGSIRTDADGRFTLRLNASVDEASEWSPGTKRRISLLDLSSHKGLMTKQEIPLVLPVGETRLGDIVLKPRPLIVAGHFVGADPSSISARDLEIQVQDEDGAWVEGEDFQIADSWRSPATPENRFEVRGFATEEFRSAAKRIRLRRGSYFGEPVAFRLGEDTVAVPVTSAAALRGRLVLPHGFDVKDASISLRRSKDGEAAQDDDDDESIGSSIALDGRFEIFDIQPGEYALTFNTLSHLRQRRLRDLILSSGTTTDLGEIDLRGRLHRFVVHAQSDDEHVIAGARYSLVEEGENRGLSIGLTNSSPGSIDVFDLATPLQFEITASGYRKIRRRFPPGVHSVTLAPAILVDVVLADSDIELPAHTSFSILLADDAQSPRKRHQAHPTASPGRWQAALDVAGSYRVTVRLIDQSPGRYEVHAIATFEPQPLLDTPKQELNLKFTDAQLEKLQSMIRGMAKKN